MYFLVERTIPEKTGFRFEDFLIGERLINTRGSYKLETTTHLTSDETPSINIEVVRREIRDFFRRFPDFYNKTDFSDCYSVFHIPKKSGGMREIDAPNDRLKEAQNTVRAFLENTLGLLPHNAAFAYFKERSCINAIEKHRQADNTWFMKLDFHNFFGSVHYEEVIDRLAELKQVHDLSDDWTAWDGFKRMMSCCFLNDVLPQGSPVSPTLCNLIMVELDKYMNCPWNKFVYTRYADDILISAKRREDCELALLHIRQYISRTFTELRLNDKKTRIGRRAGKNWNLGLMLNKDNQITVGHETKKVFKSMLLHAYNDIRDGAMTAHKANQILGLYSYYKSIEKDYIDYVVDKFNRKMNTDIIHSLKTI